MYMYVYTVYVHVYTCTYKKVLDKKTKSYASASEHKASYTVKRLMVI